MEICSRIYYDFAEVLTIDGKRRKTANIIGTMQKSANDKYSRSYLI